VRRVFIRDALALVLSVAVLDSPFPTVGLVKHRRLRMSRLKTCAQWKEITFSKYNESCPHHVDVRQLSFCVVMFLPSGEVIHHPLTFDEVNGVEDSTDCPVGEHSDPDGDETDAGDSDQEDGQRDTAEPHREG
jgi:hypothetical protein